MYSNLVKYVPNRKPPMGAVMNPYLLINRGLVLNSIMWEGSGNIVSDLSGNGRTMVLTGGSPVWGASSLGSSLTFNNDYHGVITHTGLYEFPANTDDFTLIAWVTRPVGSTDDYILDKRDGNDDGYRLLFGWGASNRFAFSINTVDITSPENLFQDGKLHMGAVSVHRASTGYLYVDGVEVASGNVSGQVMSTSANLLIGGSLAGTDDYVGDIVLVLIYNRALNAFEIAELYREPFCGFRWTNIIELASYVAAAGGIQVLRRRRAC